MSATAVVDAEADAADAALLKWARSDTNRRFIAWLRSEAGPDDWHVIAERWGLDDGVTVQIWIATRAECDRGTALALFWHTGAGFFVPSGPGFEWNDLDAADFLDLVRRRWLAGRYQRGELAYDPYKDDYYPDFPVLEGLYGEEFVTAIIPPSMRGAQPGRVIPWEARGVDGVSASFFRSR